MRRDGKSRRGAADILCSWSEASARRGNLALARAQLLESLNLVQTGDPVHAGSAALHAAAVLAEAIGQYERAVELLGAVERLLRKHQAHDDTAKPHARTEALERLRAQLGADRLEAAGKKSHATPFPLEYYTSTTLRWLEDLDPADLVRGGAGRAGHAPTTTQDTDPGSTALLLAQVRDGSPAARERLAGRYWQALRRFGHGRLPVPARDLMDTDDLVQVAELRALEKLDTLHPRRKGDFFAYLRRILINLVRDEFRRVRGRPKVGELRDALPSAAASPLDEVLGSEALAAYRAALSRLSPRQREALILRIELGLSYQEVADAAGCRTANAARMLVTRALALVAEAIERADGGRRHAT